MDNLGVWIRTSVFPLSALLIAGCIMTSTTDTTFRFKDYRNDKSLTDALLKLHPPGSSVETARATLERAGSKCQAGGAAAPGERVVARDYLCRSSYTSGLVRVDLVVIVSGNDAGEILNFSASRQLTGM